VVNVHPVALDALVEFLARVAPPAGIDICLDERDLLDRDVRLGGHGGKRPVKQGLRIAVPARASGKREDFYGHR